MSGQKLKDLGQKLKNQKPGAAHRGWGVAALCIQTPNSKKNNDEENDDVEIGEKRPPKIDDTEKKKKQRFFDSGEEKNDIESDEKIKTTKSKRMKAMTSK